MRHNLKIEKRWLDAVVEGRKRAEIRRADRPFAEGDELLLYTADRAEGELVRIEHVLPLGEIPGLACAEEYVALSIEPVAHLEGDRLAAEMTVAERGTTD